MPRKTVLKSTLCSTRTTGCRYCGVTIQGRPSTVDALMRLHIKAEHAARPDDTLMPHDADIVTAITNRLRSKQHIEETTSVRAIGLSDSAKNKPILTNVPISQNMAVAVTEMMATSHQHYVP